MKEGTTYIGLDATIVDETKFKLYIFCKCKAERETEPKIELVAVIDWGYKIEMTIGKKPADTKARVTVPAGLPKLSCPVSDDDKKVLQKAKGKLFTGVKTE